MSPSVLATVGVLVMSSSDVGWKLMLVQWLEHRNEPDKDLLTGKLFVESLYALIFPLSCYFFFVPVEDKCKKFIGRPLHVVMKSPCKILYKSFEYGLP